MKRFSWGVAVCAAMLLTAGPAHAQQPAAAGVRPADVTQVREEVSRLKAELEAIRRQYDDRISQLEQRLNQLTGGPMALEASRNPGLPGRTRGLRPCCRRSGA